jgi:hypothetical protein
MLEYRLILRSRKKAKQLLGKAKRKVEKLIERKLTLSLVVIILNIWQTKIF